MVNRQNLGFRSSDGIHTVHALLWEPEEPICGVVQLVHGVAEHIGRYDAFAQFLADQGYVVAGDDHLGHGHTVQDESELGWFAEADGWDMLVRDEKKLHDLLQKRYPNVPMILLGHSMGSFISRTYLGYYPQDFDACILSGTGHYAPVVCGAGKVLAKAEIKRHGSKYRSKALQSIAFGGYLKGIDDPIGPNDWICRDEAVIRAYGQDPLCGFTATAGLMYDMMDGLSIICRKEHLASMRKTMPVLFISGAADPVGGWSKGVNQVADLFTQAGMKRVTVKLYPGARHEVLNELNRGEVWQDVAFWLTRNA
jgi:alpha-beta hydrolase superfamily lysophospholipase